MTNLEGTFIQTDPDNTQKQGDFISRALAGYASTIACRAV